MNNNFNGVKMKKELKKFLALFPMMIVILFIGCTDDSFFNVDNNDYSAEESFLIEQLVGSLIELELRGINGEIEIAGVPDLETVTITGTRKVESDSQEDADEHLEDLSVRVRTIGNKLLVETIQPEDNQGRNYTIDYTIEIPQDFELEIQNVNGTVSIENIINLVSVDNVNGNIVLNEITGSVLVDLVNGTINGEVTLPLNGLIDMRNVNGIVILNIPEDTSAMFAASVTNGNIDMNNLELQDVEVGSSFVNGTLGNGEGNIILSLVNGNIDVNGF
jgi:putative adhesin